MSATRIDITLPPRSAALFFEAMVQAAVLFAPLLFAGVLAAVVIKWDLLAWSRRPIDGGLAVRGKRLFGDNKTWRGLLVAVVGSAVFAVLQARCPLAALDVRTLTDWTLTDWDGVPAALFGALMGLGAVLGELPNSFTKRQLGIGPGKSTKGPLSILFYVLDQVDLLFGAWLLIGWWVRPSALLVAGSFVLALAVHPMVSLVGWLLGVRPKAR